MTLRVGRRSRKEQDYWLTFSDTKTATDAERRAFLDYDSRGGARPDRNPILFGKIRHGQIGEVLREMYFDLQGGWIGGLELLRDFRARKPFGLRSLREWFGDKAVERWLKADKYSKQGGIR